MKKPTLLIIPYTPTLSHISRPLEIAKFLKKSGFSIVFAGFNTKKSKLSFIEDEGFNSLPLYEPDPDILFNNIRRGELAFVSRSTLTKMIRSDILLFNKVKPDLVLTDGRFSAMISTQIYGVPHAAVVNASSTEYRSVPYIPMFDTPFMNLIKNHGLNQICDTINLKLEMKIFDSAMRAFTKLSNELNFKTKVTATNCLAGKDLTFLADIPEYFPVKNKPANYHYIGPITWKRSGFTPMPAWWPKVKNNETKKIYITMGTTGEDNLFSKIYNVFKQSDFISIVTTGSQTNGLKTIPGRIYVENYLDGEEVIETSDLVICHGGNGTIYQALALGKPILGIPTIPDQEYNMRRVEALGVGLRLPMEKAMKDPFIVKEKTDYILNNMDLFKPGLTQMKERLKQFNGAQTAADKIMLFLENRA